MFGKSIKIQESPSFQLNYLEISSLSAKKCENKQILSQFFCLSNLFYVILHEISILYIVAKLKKIMKIKKLYAEPAMRIHKLRTSTILQASSGNESKNDNYLPIDPYEPIDAD